MTGLHYHYETHFSIIQQSAYAKMKVDEVNELSYKSAY